MGFWKFLQRQCILIRNRKVTVTPSRPWNEASLGLAEEYRDHPAPDYDRDLLYSELRRDEGVCPTIYQDSLGIWTYGVGHNGNKPLSARAMKVILEDDVLDAEADLDRTFPPWRTELTERRKRVLSNMMFNMGLPTFGDGPDGFPKFWAAMRAKDYPEAERQMDSLWSRQVGIRAERLRDMMKEG